MFPVRRGVALVSLLLCAGLAAGCGSGGGGGTKDPVRIVVEGPISGEQSATGTDMRNAAQLAVEEANRAGGVDGRRIVLSAADDRADPAVGRQVAGRAVADGAFAVIGPYNSSVGIENLRTYVTGGVIPIHLTSNAATDGLGYTVQPKDYQVAPVEAAAITRDLKAKRVAIVYDTSTYTAGIAKQVRAALRRAGAMVVLYRPIEEKRLDARAVVGAIEAAHPDLYYASTYFPEGGAIAHEAKARGVTAACLMGLANQDAKFVETAGLAAARRCSSSGVPSPQQFEGAGTYVRDYRARFGVAPGTWGTFAYDSVRLLLAAVREAGGWDPGRVKAVLSGTRGYAGVTGPIDIDRATGHRTNVPVVLLRIDAKGHYVVDPRWAASAGYGAAASPPAGPY